MLQKIYEQMANFYDSIEEEYGPTFGDNFDWEHVHFKFLIYYLVRYGIGCHRDFIVYHYRVAYRLYLEKLVMNGVLFLVEVILVNFRTNLLFYVKIIVNS